MAGERQLTETDRQVLLQYRLKLSEERDRLVEQIAVLTETEDEPIGEVMQTAAPEKEEDAIFSIHTSKPESYGGSYLSPTIQELPDQPHTPQRETMTTRVCATPPTLPFRLSSGVAVVSLGRAVSHHKLGQQTETQFGQIIIPDGYMAEVSKGGDIYSQSINYDTTEDRVLFKITRDDRTWTGQSPQAVWDSVAPDEDGNELFGFQSEEVQRLLAMKQLPRHHPTTNAITSQKLGPTVAAPTTQRLQQSVTAHLKAPAQTSALEAPARTVEGSSFISCPLCSREVPIVLMNSHMDFDCPALK